LGEHGVEVRVPIARLTTDQGLSGFGACWATYEQAASLLGRRLDEVLSPAKGVIEPWLPFEFPLLDLAGTESSLPVFALVTGGRVPDQPFHVRCYDTSLYFDDLHLTDDRAAADLIAAEARAGYEQGHRAFKLKVGRGARHLPLEAGMRRDIAVVRAVRREVGPVAVIMLDANNGYNLNLTKRMLAETADCAVFWMEEAFHEDDVLYADLQEWLRRENLSVLIADGEGQASPRLLDWAREGLIDVVQYDIFDHGFTRWLATGHQLDAWGRHSAPHHYGRCYGNYVAGHLARAIQRFTFVEWDAATVPGLDASAYTLRDGEIGIPIVPGFGVALDEEFYAHSVAAAGFHLT
jgi:L-alanine-DL-glutamate epimerase-like enolase superfamily enzyme